jgi:hypothetical protein
MPQNQRAELLLEASRQAAERLQAQTPRTPEWIDAQHDLVRIRAAYWNEMRNGWKTADRSVAATARTSIAKTAATERVDR